MDPDRLSDRSRWAGGVCRYHINGRGLEEKLQEIFGRR